MSLEMFGKEMEDGENLEWSGYKHNRIDAGGDSNMLMTSIDGPMPEGHSDMGWNIKGCGLTLEVYGGEQRTCLKFSSGC